MQFVDKNTYYIEYGKVTEMMKTLTREIATVDEYIAWVREWRAYHAGLVSGIKSLRDIKNGIKVGAIEPVTKERESSINRAQNSKMNLRPFAKHLYELRTERKANFKNGVYGDPTYHPREVEAA